VQFTVDTGELKAKATFLSQAALDIEERLQELLVQINSLEVSWQGQASTTMREFYAGFDARARALNKELGEIGQAMAAAADNYDGTEGSIARSFNF
jgi:WXG100 family type VII secretion target